MKNIFLLVICLSLTSCYQMCDQRNQVRKQEAQSMYNSFGTTIVDMGEDEARSLFGCYYRRGDRVYVYKTLWGEKYILVRYGDAITYIEGREKPAGRLFN